MTLTAPASDSLSSASAFASSSPSVSSAGESTFDSHRPLSSRVDLEARVRQLVPCAVQRQLWLLLLDADDVQLPVMVPLGDIPLRGGSADGEGLIEMLRSLAREFEASSFVFILERPGPPSPRYDDRLWLSMLLSVARTDAFDVRAAFLAHDAGIVRYGADDLAELDSAPTAACGVGAEVGAGVGAGATTQATATTGSTVGSVAGVESSASVRPEWCTPCVARGDASCSPHSSGDESRCLHQAVSASSFDV
jgi:hypothetical protein